MPCQHRLAVWGDPIAHSKSPALHAAAYRLLGVEWEYGRRRVDAAGFAAAFESLDDSWRGLSLTMPLKEQAFRAAVTHDRHAELTGAVNTLLLTGGPTGFNTDVGGIIDALAGSGVHVAERARILGAGATASSAMVAVAELGARRIDIRARHPDRADALRTVGAKLGIDLTVQGFDASSDPADVTVATLPGGTALDASVAAALASGGGTLLDAAYAPWPSALAAAWQDSHVISGLEMLLHQAVRQVRVFVNGDPVRELENEGLVRDEMRSALVGD